MTGIRTPIPQLKKKILFFLDKVEGTGKIKLSHHLREQDSSLIYKTQAGTTRSLSMKKTLYKSKPLEKFIVLPPDYKTGKLKPVTPIRSANDNSFIYEGQAGSLIVPKKAYVLPASPRLPTERESINLDKKVKELNSRIKELSQRLIHKNKHKRRPRNTINTLADSVKISQDCYRKSNNLSPTQNMLLKKWEGMFNDI